MFPYFPYSDMYTLNLDWLLKKAGEYDQLFKGIKATAKDGDATGVVVSVGPDGGYQFDFTINAGEVAPVESNVIIHQTRTIISKAIAELEYSKIKTETQAGKLPIVQDENFNFYFPALGIHQAPGYLTYARLDDPETKKIVFLMLNIADNTPGWKRYENDYTTSTDVEETVAGALETAIPAVHPYNNIQVVIGNALNRPAEDGNIEPFSPTALLTVGSVTIPAHTTAYLLGIRQTVASPFPYAWAFGDGGVVYNNTTDNAETVNIQLKAYNNSNVIVTSKGLGKPMMLFIKNDVETPAETLNGIMQSVTMDAGRPAEIEPDFTFITKS